MTNQTKELDDVVLIISHNQEYEGKKQTLRQWANELGLEYGTLWERIHRNKYPLRLALQSKRYDGKNVLKNFIN